MSSPRPVRILAALERDYEEVATDSLEGEEGAEAEY